MELAKRGQIIEKPEDAIKTKRGTATIIIDGLIAACKSVTRYEYQLL